MESNPATRPTKMAKRVKLLFVIVFKVFTKPHHKECQTHHLNCNRHIAFYCPRAHIRTKDTWYYGSRKEKDATNSIVDIRRFLGHPVVYLAATRAIYNATNRKRPSKASCVKSKERGKPS